MVTSCKQMKSKYELIVLDYSRKKFNYLMWLDTTPSQMKM